MSKVTVVLPCFNEARRLRRDELRSLVSEPDFHVLCVDDGSTDGTSDLLREIEQESGGRIQTLVLEKNGGKAEAVRGGMLRAIADGATLVGFLDADFATPSGELIRLHREMSKRGAQVAMAARISRAGARIERSAARHYVGRVFSTAASLILDAQFYDTQCGAKLFANGPALRAAIASPFLSRWAFDVELLGRLLEGAEPLPRSAFFEMPLELWTDVKGSKLSLRAMARSAADLAIISRQLKSMRRGARHRAS